MAARLPPYLVSRWNVAADRDAVQRPLSRLRNAKRHSSRSLAGGAEFQEALLEACVEFSEHYPAIRCAGGL